jgi:general secretion pathway protein F
MAAFEYQALDPQGRTQTGVLQSDTARSARSNLRDRGLNPLVVRQVGDAAVISARASSLSTSELVLLSSQLSTLLGSGLPIDEALHAIVEGSDGRLKRHVAELRSRVMEGASLAQAMGESSRAYPPLYRASIAAGEAAGALHEVLARLAEFAESRDALKRRVQIALAYPILLLMIALAVVVGLMLWVVPEVTGVFSQYQQRLPLPTRVLTSVSGFIAAHGVSLIIGVAAVVVSVALASRSRMVRGQWDRFCLTVPVLGRLLRASETSRFARTLALLVGSAVPLLEALGIANQVVQNEGMRKALDRVAASVREGQPFARALQETGQFPPIAVRLIASGEKSGRLGAMLHDAANFQERELDTALGISMAALGPAVILLVGGLVLFIVLAILLPIFEMNSLIR